MFNLEKSSIYELNGMPYIGKSIPMALQHVVAMIVGCVTPALIFSQAVTSSVPNHGIILVQSALIIAALATFIQLFPIGKYFGSKLPVIMGVSFAYLSSMLAIAEQYDLSAIFGAQIVVGIVAALVRVFV